MKNASNGCPLLLTSLSLCYNPLFSTYSFGSWLNTPHICLIKRFKAKEMSELCASCLSLLKMEGMEKMTQKKEKGQMIESSESVFGFQHGIYLRIQNLRNIVLTCQFYVSE